MSVRALLAAWTLAAGLSVTVPAAACSPVATRCEPDGCNGPLYRQDLRERQQREAIDYGRAMAVAVEARLDAPGLDRAADVARLVLPLVVNPVDYADGGSCGPEIEDSHGAENQRAIPVEQFVADMRTRAGLPANREPPRSRIAALSALRLACQDEATTAFATYLGNAVPPDQLAEVWDFLLPRAGVLPPADPREQLAGWRFTRVEGADNSLTYNSVSAPQHVDGRRERAWQYLQNHRNGRAVMSAVSQFIQSRLADGRGEAALCPVAHAEMQRLIGELARP